MKQKKESKQIYLKIFANVIEDKSPFIPPKVQGANLFAMHLRFETILVPVSAKFVDGLGKCIRFLHWFLAYCEYF